MCIYNTQPGSVADIMYNNMALIPGMTVRHNGLGARFEFTPNFNDGTWEQVASKESLPNGNSNITFM